MFYLIQRRYNEANYCIRMFKQISDKKLSIENIAFLLTKIFSKTKVYRLLRIYYWIKKKIKNRLYYKIYIDPIRFLKNLIQTPILVIDENKKTK